LSKGNHFKLPFHSSCDKFHGDRGSYLPVYKYKPEGEVNSMMGQMMTHYMSLRQHFNMNVLKQLSAHPASPQWNDWIKTRVFFSVGAQVSKTSAVDDAV
jgi:hypothetical protein